MELPDEIFQPTPTFGYWDRLYAKLSVVHAGYDPEDGVELVRPVHPIDWILKPIRKAARRKRLGSD